MLEACVSRFANIIFWYLYLHNLAMSSAPVFESCSYVICRYGYSLAVLFASYTSMILRFRCCEEMKVFGKMIVGIEILFGTR